MMQYGTIFSMRWVTASAGLSAAAETLVGIGLSVNISKTVQDRDILTMED